MDKKTNCFIDFEKLDYSSKKENTVVVDNIVHNLTYYDPSLFDYTLPNKNPYKHLNNPLLEDLLMKIDNNDPSIPKTKQAKKLIKNSIDMAEKERKKIKQKELNERRRKTII